MKSVQEQNKMIVQKAFDGWDSGNADIFDEVYAEDVDHPQINHSEESGLVWLKQFVHRWVEAFPDQNHVVHHMVAEGDWVATRFSITGTHLGKWRENEPTGEQFLMEGMAMERLENGKIVERWIIEDTLDFNKTLGVVTESQ